MEHTLNHGMCRCCASEGMFKNFSATYQWMGADEVYADMLKECFDITLTTAEDYNNGGICEVCITQLRNASNFKKQVLQTEEQFKKTLQDDIFKTSIVKEELNKEDGDYDSDNNISEDFSGTEYEVPIKEELSVEPKAKKRSAKASTSSAKRAKKEDGEPSNKRRLLPGIRIKERAEESEDEIIDIDAEIKATRSNIGNDLVKNRINFKKIMRYSNATPFRDVKAQGYLCSYCPKMFPDPADLKTHTIAIHDEETKMTLMKQLRVYCVKLDITNLECSKCNAEMESLEELIDHLINAHNKALYKNIKNFLLPFKLEDRVWFDCAVCAKRFNKFKVLLEHMNMHYRNFVCDVCGAGFAYHDILRHHSRIHVKGEFVCSFCSKQYDTLRKKKGHESAVHKRGKMVNKCGVCDAKFVSYQTKLQHMEDEHGIDMVVMECDACDRTFTNPSAHRIHVQRDHLFERRFQCNLCGKKFFDSDLLKNHVMIHTGERPYQCLICLKKFQRKSSHREHMRIHADDRRYKCEHCGMAFVQRCTWRTHMRKIHGVAV